MVEQRGLVLHIAEGSYEGTISWQKNPAAQVSSHFVVDYDGKIAQVVDTDTAAWTQGNGNGHWLSVENAGFHSGQFTAQQVEACAQLLARGHKTYGYPLVIANNPNERGLGHHGMGGAAWGGHPDCPGPNNVALKPTILARAIAIVNGNTEDDMTWLVRNPADGGIYAANGVYRRRCASQAEVDALKAAGAKDLGNVTNVAWFGLDVEHLPATPVDVELTPEQLADIGDAARQGAAEGIDGARITTTP